MFERFTERAREAVKQARVAADEQKAGRITTGHLLVGLFRDEGAIAASVLSQRGLTVERLVEELPSIAAAEPAPDGVLATDEPPFSAECKRALELSLREALSLGHNYIGTEHLLLGLDRARDCDAMKMLHLLGFKPRSDGEESDVRRDVLRLLTGAAKRESDADATYTVVGLFCRNCGWEDVSVTRKMRIPKGQRVETALCPNCGLRGVLDRRDT